MKTTPETLQKSYISASIFPQSPTFVLGFFSQNNPTFLPLFCMGLLENLKELAPEPTPKNQTSVQVMLWTCGKNQ